MDLVWKLQNVDYEIGGLLLIVPLYKGNRKKTEYKNYRSNNFATYGWKNLCLGASRRSWQ